MDDILRRAIQGAVVFEVDDDGVYDLPAACGVNIFWYIIYVRWFLRKLKQSRRRLRYFIIRINIVLNIIQVHIVATIRQHVMDSALLLSAIDFMCTLKNKVYCAGICYSK